MWPTQRSSRALSGELYPDLIFPPRSCIFAFWAPPPPLARLRNGTLFLLRFLCVSLDEDEPLPFNALFCFGVVKGSSGWRAVSRFWTSGPPFFFGAYCFESTARSVREDDRRITMPCVSDAGRPPDVPLLQT